MSSYWWQLVTFILQGLLQDIEGLQYVCEFPDQLSAVLQLLGNMVASLSERPSVRLLKQVLKCYVHLLHDERYAILNGISPLFSSPLVWFMNLMKFVNTFFSGRSLKALKSSFPERLSDGTFDHYVCVSNFKHTNTYACPHLSVVYKETRCIFCWLLF